MDSRYLTSTIDMESQLSGEDFAVIFVDKMLQTMMERFGCINEDDLISNERKKVKQLGRNIL